jgi:DNA-binding CsgD family transcriptional regulator
LPVEEHGQAIDLIPMLERARVPAGIVDRQGLFTWQNDAARATVGDVLGRPLTSFVAPEDVPKVERQLESKLAGGPPTDYEVDILTPDRKRRHAEISSIAIPNGDVCQAIFGVAVVGPPQAEPASAGLTPRQYEVLQLLGEGASTADIARMLHLTTETVRNHIRSILRALGAHSRLEAVAVAYRKGLLHEP